MSFDRPGRVRPSLAVAVGLGLPALAYVLQKLVWPFIPPSPHLFFFPAVFFAACVAGARAGALATAASAVGIAYGFLPPAPDLWIEAPRDLLNLGIFASVSLVLSVVVHRLRETAARERAARIAADETWAMIAHDLRTPLSTIRMGTAQLTRRLQDRGGDLDRAARIIERSSTRALSLLQDAVDAVKLTEGAFELHTGPCDVRELFAHVAESTGAAAAQAGVRVDMDVATSRALVCDEPRIAQVLENLVGNALRFTPRGGSVSLVADDDGDGVRIAVRDTGRGIAQRDLDIVFSKHWSKDSGGSGLGLWIVRGIIEAHRSSITVTSTEGAGTSFAFSLPAMADERAAPA